jgi:hypothetical protein
MLILNDIQASLVAFAIYLRASAPDSDETRINSPPGSGWGKRFELAHRAGGKLALFRKPNP